MPKLTKSTPQYRLHRASGQAICYVDGRAFYLGLYKSKASRVEYDRIISEWLAHGRRLPSAAKQESTTVVELIAAYRRFAKRYYRRHDGTPSGEVHILDDALKPLKKLYGRSSAIEFGPKQLKAVRQSMITAGWTRRHINRQVSRTRRMFKWAAEEELVPGSIFQNLAAVAGLKVGRSEARESDPVKPVDDQTVDATLPHLPDTVADMIRFQLLTGSRPGEVCQLCPRDVDRSDDVWELRPAHHKTKHLNRERVIYIGPKAQDILRPYLLRSDGDVCFQPCESEVRRRKAAHARRKTPLSCGNRPGRTRTPTARPRTIGGCYTPNAYRRAVYRAVGKANTERKKWNSEHPDLEPLPILEKWSPGRLRHSAATAIRKRYGLEAAQVCLGHAAADVTQIYAERDAEKAREVMKQIG